MKKYIYSTILIAFLTLLTGLIIQRNKAKKYWEYYEKAIQNVEAYQLSNAGLEGEIREYKMTIDELYASKDSLDMKLVATMDELKLSNNQIKNLQYQLSQATKTDTITLHDTIFAPNVDVDTIVGDYWYNIRLQLQFPSTVITTPTLNSEQFIYIFNKREYVGGKSKCFFINWFKKKYNVTEVKVEEKNPYIKITKQKFIEVE